MNLRMVTGSILGLLCRRKIREKALKGEKEPQAKERGPLTVESQSACEREAVTRVTKSVGPGCTLIVQCWTYPRTLRTNTLRPRDIKTEGRLRTLYVELRRDEARPNQASIFGTGTWVVTSSSSSRRLSRVPVAS